MSLWTAAGARMIRRARQLQRRAHGEPTGRTLRSHLPRDPVPGMMEQNQIDKKVRVVSTIEYRLRD